MASNDPRERLFLYPEPIRGPDVPYKNDRKPNPSMRGMVLVIAAFLMETFEFVTRQAWKNAGFGSLNRIYSYVKDLEPWFEPVVYPIKDTSLSASNDHGDNPRQQQSQARPNHKKNSVAYYRSLYLSGELAPLDVANAILPLIRRDTNPPGQHSIAWFDVDVARVLQAAQASTLRYKEKRSLGPMDGVPTAVKDEYDMEGYKTTLGSPNNYAAFSETTQPDAINSWCVKQLEAAGAIILGKLSMHEFGLDTSGNNILFGTPRNPYNSDYYPGGSSSGCAYAVANGLIPIVLGSDGGGSIRIPSSFCSVFGLKPTHGRVSFHPCQNHSVTCGVNGPIGADIQSLATMFDIISQPDPTSYFPPLTTQLSPTTRPKFLGIPEAWFKRATPAVQTLCNNLIIQLAKQKDYTIVPITIPFLPEGQIAHSLTVLTDGATLLPKSTTKGLSPANRILLALGRITPSTDYLLAQKLRRLLMQHLAWLWKTHPGMVIVTPTTACAGWRIKSSSELKYGVSDGDKTLETMEYVWLANFCGVPAITVPAGYVVPEGADGAGEVAGLETRGKVPVGLMAVGEWCGEQALLEFGLDAEEVGGDCVARPPGWVDVVQLAREARSAR